MQLTHSISVVIRWKAEILLRPKNFQKSLCWCQYLSVYGVNQYHVPPWQMKKCKAMNFSLNALQPWLWQGILTFCWICRFEFKILTSCIFWSVVKGRRLLEFHGNSLHQTRSRPMQSANYGSRGSQCLRMGVRGYLDQTKPVIKDYSSNCLVSDFLLDKCSQILPIPVNCLGPTQGGKTSPVL